jgi:hypothetical protein
MDRIALLRRRDDDPLKFHWHCQHAHTHWYAAVCTHTHTRHLTPALTDVAAFASPHANDRRTADPQAAVVAEAVQEFITVMDSLKLSMRAVDQLVPVLLSLLSAMDRVSTLPPGYAPREKIRVRGAVFCCCTSLVCLVGAECQQSGMPTADRLPSSIVCCIDF